MASEPIGYISRSARVDNAAHEMALGDQTFRFPKFTLYHFLVVFSTALLGLPKAWYAYHGYSTVPNTMDWLSGVLVFLMVYWLGIYEKHVDHDMPWLFERDLLAPVKRRFNRAGE